MKEVMSQDCCEVSIVIPCLNEVKTVGVCVKNAKACFEKYGLKGEVIVSDNGSSDGSQQVAEEAGALVVDQPVKGYGAALRKGFEFASGTYIVMGDADGAHDFMDVYRFVDKLKEGYDVVMGSRLKGEIKPRAMPWMHRYIGNPLFTFILNMLYHTGVSDVHCGMRGFKRDCLSLMDLRTQGMELASEMVIKFVRAGLKFTEIPITQSPTVLNRKPHLRPFKDGWRHLRLMLMFAPNVLFFWPGVFLCVSGLLMQGIILIRHPLVFGAIHLDVNMMILSMMGVIFGLQMVYQGLFACLFIYTEIASGQSKQLKIMMMHSKFEKGIFLGIIFLLIGLLGNGFMLLQWGKESYGSFDLAAIRQTIFYSTLLMMGIQIIFASFFLNMIGVDRAIYAGDLHLHKKEGARGKAK